MIRDRDCWFEARPGALNFYSKRETMTKLDEVKEAITDLVKDGELYRKVPKQYIGGRKAYGENCSKLFPSLLISYQQWYAKCLPLIKQIAPERYNEFVELYKVEKRKELNILTAGVNDYLQGMATIRGVETQDYLKSFAAKMQLQTGIINSLKDRIDSILSDIVGLLHADIFDSEIEGAEELFKAKHFRASGVLAGVVLESHLKTFCKNHGVLIKKKTPTLSDYNDKLKKEELIDLPKFRFNQHLGDLRNICAHSKERAPTEDEVRDLLDGVKKVTKTIN